MIDAISTIRGLWPVISRLPGWVVGWMFPAARLADLMYVDMMPRHDSATVNLADLASFDVYLQVINLSPFVAEVDRAELVLQCGGAPLKAQNVRKQKIASGEIAMLHFSNSISDGAARHIALQSEVRAWVEGHIEFNGPVRQFAKHLRQLDGVNIRLLNRNARQTS